MLMTIPSQSFASVVNVMNDPQALFVIPTFQRPYAWEERQIRDLIKDITNKSHIKSAPSYPEHYFSPIHLTEITVRNGALNLGDYLDLTNPDIEALLKSAPGGYFCDHAGLPVKVFMVIDGQQRLTTLFVLYHLFYHHNSPSTPSGLFTTLHRNHLVPRVIQNPPEDHRFMRAVLSHFTKGTPPRNPTRQSQRHLLDAFNRLNNWITQIPNPAIDLSLLNSPSFKTALVELDPNFALTSFMTLNDRGKDLTVLEKFKALLMEYDLNHCNRSNSTLIHTVFGNLYQVLDESIYLGLISPKSRADDRFMQLLSAYIRGGADASAQWQDGGTAYSEFFGPALECVTKGSPSNFSCSHPLVSGKTALVLIREWLSQINEVVEGLDHLNQIVAGKLFSTKTSIFYPTKRTLADDYRVIFNSLTLSPSTVALLLKFRAKTGAEWHDRFPVSCQTNPPALQILHDALNRIEPEHPHTVQVINEIREKIPSMSEDGVEIEVSMLEVAERIELSVWALGAPRINFVGKWFATQNIIHPSIFVTAWSAWWTNTHAFLNTILNWSNERLCKYILREKEAASGLNIHFSLNLELEHIFPQTPGHWNIKSYGFQNQTDYDRFIGKIGNMTYLYEPCNAHVGNDPPDQKAPHYIACPGHPAGLNISSVLSIVKDVGNKLTPLGSSLPEYRKVLEARCVEFAAFCLGRFPLV